MKQITLVCLCLVFALGANAQQSIMTFNIRYNNPKDGENWWEKRKEDVGALVNFYRPDVMGIQEGLHDQVVFLDDFLPQYSYVGVGRDDGKEKGEYAAIFYNKSSLEVLDTKTYWLSETPDKVSVGWDASMERIVTYAKFKDKDNQKILHVFNCHYDHIGPLARENSSKVVLDLIKKMGIGNERIAVIGDLNSLPESKPIQVLTQELKDAFETSEKSPYGPVGTFNSFKSMDNLEGRIDYILVKNLKVKSYVTIDDKRKNGFFVSDHLPVMVAVD
ncbi:endonuclease/exonuclease/phosphatase family protein [Flagellimonas algicola]|uniref:Endonuclease/exonuclease/phosphatase family protein n=1 Tax=Flagellimonas algicola TaxID=2583815 RepID=A0ABY2WIF9_9FLAO|nr:endonuclease/exonuclease/phosphatase family protein [Allomuricauda algicola]TMU51041.1 endonuclease/exonuclease/phosphatase family protein [Allomuricauda algicola]